MFKNWFDDDMKEEREELRAMSDRELMIEMILELKKINEKCDDIANKIFLLETKI